MTKLTTVVSLAVALSGLGAATTATAADDAAQVTPAQVEFAGCNDPYPVPAGVNPSTALLPLRRQASSGSDGGGILTVGAGIIGDVANAALGSLAAAIEEASKERTFGGRGVTVFDFYYVSGDQVAPIFPGLLDGGACLNIAVPVTISSRDAARTETGLAARFVLKPWGEGFTLVPLEVQYLRPVGGLGSRDRLPIEFTANFSVPGADDGGQGIFGIAQISLPALRPGEELDQDALRGFTSMLMSYRPSVADQPTDDRAFGAVSVDAQLFVRRAENAFGTAIATALKGRQEALGQAVTDMVTTRFQSDAWTAQDSDYYNAMIEAREALADYRAAVEANDLQSIRSARVAVVAKRGEANVAAAAVDRSAPFPDPLAGL